MSLRSILQKVTVEPVLFSYMFCVFMSLPLLQQLAYRKICFEVFNKTLCKNLTKIQQNEIQSKTSEWLTYQSVAFAVPSICSSLVLGSWSDSAGRKSIMVLPPIGSVLTSVNHMLNIYFFQLDVDYLFIGIVIGGFFGGFATTLSAVFSYISDITNKSNRTIRIGILESMVFLGACCGELLTGVLLDHSGYMVAYGVVLGVNVLIILYITLILKESYHPNEGTINPLLKLHQHIKSVWIVLFKRRPENNRMYLLVILFGALSIILINFGGFNDISLLYVMKKPLHMSSTYIGYFLAEVYLIRGLGVVIGMPIMTNILKLSDYMIAIIGTFVFSITFVIFGFSTHVWMVFVGAIFGIGGGLPVPCMRSIMSKCVESNEQGTMFAAVACLEVLYTLLASLIFNTLYSKTVSWMPGFSFFLLAAILVIPVLILLWLYIKTRLRIQYRAMENTTGGHDANAIQDNEENIDSNHPQPIC